MAFRRTRAPSRGLDATSILTVYVVLLLGVPSAMVVAPLGSAGALSTIMAIGCFCWWIWFQIHRTGADDVGARPVRISVIVWLLIMLAVYVHAMAQPIPYDEISPADSGLLKLFGLAGVLLVANDGISSLELQRTLLRRLVLGIGIIAAFGLFQYFTKELWIDRLRIPGLTAGTAGWGLIDRTGFVRPSATSTHPIEYGVVLTMALPLTIVYATRESSRKWLYRAILVVVTLAIFLSLSRSAALCALAGVIVLAAGWSNAARLRAVGFAVAVAGLVYVSFPGSLGAFTSLFTGASEDPSIGSRTGSYDIAGLMIGQSPLLGRGFGTFLPKYWILDNGYLGLLIEGGILGLLGFLAVIGSAMWAARRARRLAEDSFDREMCQALVASIAAGACGMAFFDTFGFPQTAGLLFLLLGLAGSALRLHRSRAASTRLLLPGIDHDFLGRGTAWRRQPATHRLESLATHRPPPHAP